MKVNYGNLVKEATKALDSFYGKDTNSKHIYGSAVLTDKASDTASLTLHAEQAALSHAVCHKDARIVAIAMVGKEDPKGEKLCHPCGICKQLIWENSLRTGIPIKVIMSNLKGRYKVKSIKDIVPYPWPD